jgi:hypothetical protein
MKRLAVVLLLFILIASRSRIVTPDRAAEGGMRGR